MTIRFRNRVTLIFFFIALAILFISGFLIMYNYFSGGIQLPEVYKKGLSDNFLLKYNPVIVHAGIIFEIIYVCITTMIIYHSFEKTQAPDIAFFLIFLAACLCDASRFFIPVFHLSDSYSNFLLKLGNVHLFARLLAPLALMGNTLLCSDELKQSTDRNCLVTIIIALFFSELIPLNTAVILPNYCVSYGYVKGIRIASFLIITLSAIYMFFDNKKNEYHQIMTLGFIMLSVGYTLLFYCFNILGFAAGLLLLGFGTSFYLNEVHKHYLWLD